ncbi:MAG: glycosyltransferase family 2 protein [Chlorobium sp.]|uniref:glycosyltransferase family 2 protein n=1 Tax=Chlorobium sp. TaxID=1095 RepID=UPI0025C733EB|nr:glycosyltransferase family 2 protein [Chlorobium sp.]MCF8383427.1 glycosyltransferase family 2 protein [Chlorobium sp.]
MDISIVIPLYNKKDTVARALQSVLMQTYSPREIIVVNDGSSDGSESVVRTMDIACLRLVEQDNAGVSAARNHGWRVARCEWVAFLDADDEWNPDFLGTIAALHEGFPDHEVFATAYFAGDYQGNRRPIILNRVPFLGERGVLENYFEVAACSDPPLWSSAICIRRDALHEIGGFPLNVKSGEDLLTWARLAARKPPVYSTKPLAVFWQEKAHTYDDRPNRMPEPDDPVGKGLAELKKKPEALSRDIDNYLSMWHKMRSSIYLRLGLRGSALVETLKGLYYQPLNKKLYIYLLLCAMPQALTRNIFKQFGR